MMFLVQTYGIANVISEPIQVKLFADDCVLFNEISYHKEQVILNSNFQMTILQSMGHKC